ncbi:unnamed protein product [Adineta ricciae]|uniref:Uncharacterized protein n=1 Tax=Adineta ricciae TaxID=249248 RepID=A0A814LQ14_ADIRI|nr:unnamed protein product [Adineta ricciae]CAF1370053.1 unnamed protein product [Adineta ricciae]
MPVCARDDQPSSLPPPGFAEDNTTLKRVRLIDSLEKLIQKFQREPQFIAQQPKETDLLLSIAQFILLSPSASHIDRRISFDTILAIGKDLLIDQDQMNNKENNNSSSIEIKDMTTVTVPLLPSTPPNNGNDDDFSLDDLANEYLRNDPSPPSSNEKEKFRAETNESDSTPNDVKKTSMSSAPENDILSKLFFAPIKTEPLTTKPQLESILFSNFLSVHNDDDGMWKEQSSQFGQMLCSKSIDVQKQVTKRVSTCLLDRSLYESLTRVVALLPKECIRTSSQQFSVRPNNNGQHYRPQRSNNDNRRFSNRPSFQQNSLQMYHNQRFPPGQNVRQHMNPNYSDQNSSATGYFVDRRSQQQNRYPPAPYSNDHQPRGAAPKHNPHSGGQHQHQHQHQQQKKKNPPNDNQQTQRGSKKGQGGNKSNNEKPGMPGSGPSTNPK